MAKREKMYDEVFQQNSKLVKQRERETLKYKTSFEENMRDKRTIFRLQEENANLARNLDDYKREKSAEMIVFRRQIRDLKKKMHVQFKKYRSQNEEEEEEEKDESNETDDLFNFDLPVCTDCFGCQSSRGWIESCRNCSHCWDDAKEMHVSPYDNSHQSCFEDYERHYLRRNNQK
jgi:hypothetical protein